MRKSSLVARRSGPWDGELGKALAAVSSLGSKLHPNWSEHSFDGVHAEAFVMASPAGPGAVLTTIPIVGRRDLESEARPA